MSRTRTQKNRLLRLADFLENQVKDEHFNLDVIAETESCKLPSQTACGTAACAIGHMPQVFSRTCKYSEIDESCLQYYGPENPYLLQVEGKGDYSYLRDFELAEEFFGLNSAEGEYLFVPENYGKRKGRKTVAGRIRQFVQDGQIPTDHLMYKEAVERDEYEDEEQESEELADCW